MADYQCGIHATGIRVRDLPVRIEDLLPMPKANIS